MTVINSRTGQPFPTGLIPTPRHKLASACPFQALVAAPPQYAVVPKQLDMWGNDTYGDCVSAAQAFIKACYQPEIFIPTQTVISWASRHGVLNGADLPQVMDFMQSDGFVIGSQKYDDGPYAAVDYTNQAVLQAAIFLGPVNIGIDSSALPSGAGNVQGWYKFGGGTNRNEDHCTVLSGYGTAAFCFQALGVPLPSGVDPNKPDCFLHYTWSTIGVVDLAWIRNTLGEAWVCNPTTVGVPPLTPPPPPPPPPPPLANMLSIKTALPASTYQVGTGTIIGPIAVGEYPVGDAPPPPPPPPPGSAVFTPEDRAALLKILAENPAGK